MIAKQLELFPQAKKLNVIQSPRYLHVEDEIPLSLPNASFVSVTRQKPLKIHSIGFQPAKTIPEIVRWFLHKYTNKYEYILDPFAGSGTTLIEAMSLDRNVVWADYHPLSRLICELKTNNYEPLAIYETAKNVVSNASRNKDFSVSVNFRNKDFWFQKPVQEGLETLLIEISSLPNGFKVPLSIAFATTVRKCSDMNDSMILAAKRSNVEEVPKRSRRDVYKYFEKYVEKLVSALVEWHQQVDISALEIIQVASHDARELSGDWQCDAIFTSPPYINAIDYVWAAKFELHWLGLVKNDQARLRLYSNEIGTERIPSSIYRELGSLNHPKLDQLLEFIYSGRSYQASKGQNELRSRVVFKYFVDMRQHLHEAYRRLKPGGYYCYVVGDSSQICGETIPVASFLTDFAIEEGFETDFRFNLLLKNRKLNIPRNVEWASIIKHDAVVVLRKP